MAEATFLVAEVLAICGQVPRRLRLLTIHRPDREDYGDAVARIDGMERRLASDAAPASVTGPDGGRWEPNMTPGQFHAMVDAAPEHIHAADAFQVLGAPPFRNH